MIRSLLFEAHILPHTQEMRELKTTYRSLPAYIRTTKNASQFSSNLVRPQRQCTCSVILPSKIRVIKNLLTASGIHILQVAIATLRLHRLLLHTHGQSDYLAKNGLPVPV